MNPIPSSMNDGNSFDGALTLHQAGRIAEAEQVYRRVLQQQPNHPGALHLLGVIHQQRGDHEAAVELIGRAIAVNPNKAVYRNNLAAALLSLERFVEARGSLLSALKISSQYPDALANLGLAETSLGREEEALSCFRQALQIDPRHRDARKRLAALLDNLGRFDETVGLVEAAYTAFPSADVCADLGDVYMKAARPQYAERAYRKAIDLDPSHALAHFNLGLALGALHDTAGARRHLLSAAELRPDKPWWRLRAEVCLPVIFENVEQIEAHCQRLEQALQCGLIAERDEDERTCEQAMPSPFPLPERRGTTTASPPSQRPDGGLDDIVQTGVFPELTLSYIGRNPRWLKERFAALYAPYFRDQPAPRGSGLANRKRIGFLVTRQHEGIFVRCMAGLLRHLDRERFEPVVLGARASIKLLQQRLANDRLRYVGFRDTFSDAVRTIREVACDLIYYWEVGSDALNYFLPFARLAPVQSTSHGSLTTTGLRAVDYFFSSSLMEGETAAEHYTERLWESRTLLMCQERLLPVSAPRRKWRLPEDRHLYGCLQNPLKLHPDFDALLAGILTTDANAMIVLLADRSGYASANLRNRFAKHISHAGERIIFTPQQEFRDYCGLLQACDVLLDPPHYGAGSSCYDIFSFNLPMVTMPTALMPGRVALGFYRKMQFEELIASSAEEYVSKAVQVATNREYRRHVVDQMAERSDVLFTDLDAVREHERFFEEALAAVCTR